ncbi:MAG: WYL domain-containing protein [Scytolyngbya sp. HA4215-MV1]|jgi:predicted DNA-binding transcriptional regulator YafY|nr:WYL domain-containing protein [Scytolyngbya sp. HA4215-MV1]
MGRRGQSVTLSISDRDKAQLEQLALEQGMTWGDRPNISRLVEAIARRELLLGRNNDWSDDRIRALQQAMRSLTDTGQLDEARMIAQLLLERSELTLPLRSEIERLLATPILPWRLEIDQYIRCQQPFQLTYRDAADRPWNFTIRHAHITSYERRQYLECWCEETDSNQDLPELQHNWVLRLDRIPEAALSTAPGKWHSSLDALEAEMHLLKGLAFAYEAKTADLCNEWLRDRHPPIRRIVRRVTNTFWFFREVFRYGEDCILISPDTVRERFKEKLHKLCEHYDGNT